MILSYDVLAKKKVIMLYISRLPTSLRTHAKCYVKYVDSTF